MFSETLKEKTKQAHQSLEKIIIERIKAIRSQADYIRLLQLFYGFYRPLEQLLDQYMDDTVVPRYTQRRKGGRLLQDMKQAGAETSVFHTCHELPAIHDTAAAIGALYVLEGSTLGGSIIAGMLAKQAGIPAQELTFFSGYGANNTEMWKEFVTALNTYADSNGKEKEIACAATHTFQTFERWARQWYAHHPQIATPALSNPS